MKHIG
jgi:hypothetical protein